LAYLSHIGEGMKYICIDWVEGWYGRNQKIFINLARTITPSSAWGMAPNHATCCGPAPVEQQAHQHSQARRLPHPQPQPRQQEQEPVVSAPTAQSHEEYSAGEYTTS